MLVRQGWSGETASNRWAKFDIELDETDLGRLLREHDIAPPEALSTVDAYRLLEAEAERLVRVKLAQRYGMRDDDGFLSEYRETISRLTAKYKINA